MGPLRDGAAGTSTLPLRSLLGGGAGVGLSGTIDRDTEPQRSDSLGVLRVPGEPRAAGSAPEKR